MRYTSVGQRRRGVVSARTWAVGRVLFRFSLLCVGYGNETILCMLKEVDLDSGGKRKAFFFSPSSRPFVFDSATLAAKSRRQPVLASGF